MRKEAQTGCANKAEMLLKLLLCIFQNSAVEIFSWNESQMKKSFAYKVSCLQNRQGTVHGHGGLLYAGMCRCCKPDLECSLLRVREEFSLHNPLIL